jgi:predicted Zn-dependent protease
VWLAVIVTLCCLVQPRPAGALTTEEERVMGRQVALMLQNELDMVDDPAVVTYVNQLGHKILSELPPQPYDYHFYVVDNDIINAFAVPGGHIFVNSGLITALDNEGQLAAILSHEIAHVTSRHIAGRLKQSQALAAASLAAAVLGAMVGGPVGSAIIMGAAGAAAQGQLAYSRADEREADEVGLNYLVEAGYDPRYASQSFRLMLRNTFHTPDDVPTYLSTHPGLTERITMVEAMVETHPMYQKVMGRGDQKTFQSVRNRLIALTGDTQSAQNHFRQLLDKNPQAPYAHHGLALIYAQTQDYEKAVEQFQKALELQPANPAFLTDYGEVLFRRKNMSKAVNPLSQAVVLRPADARANYLLGRTYEELDQPGKAADLYRRVLDAQPHHEQALYRLGIIYGRRGDLALAHLHTGRHFRLKGDLNQALFHFEKDKEAMETASPKVREQIETALEETKEEKKKLEDQGFGREPG